MRFGRIAGSLVGFSICVSACSVFGSTSPLHGFAYSGDRATATDAGNRKYDLAFDLLHNEGPGSIQITGVTLQTNGRLHFDGAFLLSSPTNNPGGGFVDAPFALRPGERLTPIRLSRPPTIKRGGKQFLVIRVNVPKGKAAGEVRSVAVHYLSDGHQYSTSYGVGAVICRAKFINGYCGTFKDPGGS